MKGDDMSSEDLSVLDELETLLFDHGKVVTAKMMAMTVSRPVHDVKRLLEFFWEKHKADVSAVWHLSGWAHSASGEDASGSPETFVVRLATTEKLEDTRAAFSSDPSVHVFSLQKVLPPNASALCSGQVEMLLEEFGSLLKQRRAPCSNSLSSVASPSIQFQASGRIPVRQQAAAASHRAAPSTVQPAEKPRDEGAAAAAAAPTSAAGRGSSPGEPARQEAAATAAKGDAAAGRREGKSGDPAAACAQSGGPEPYKAGEEREEGAAVRSSTEVDRAPSGAVSAAPGDSKGSNERSTGGAGSNSAKEQSTAGGGGRKERAGGKHTLMGMWGKGKGGAAGVAATPAAAQEPVSAKGPSTVMASEKPLDDTHKKIAGTEGKGFAQPGAEYSVPMDALEDEEEEEDTGMAFGRNRGAGTQQADKANGGGRKRRVVAVEDEEDEEEEGREAAPTKASEEREQEGGRTENALPGLSVEAPGQSAEAVAEPSEAGLQVQGSPPEAAAGGKKKGRSKAEAGAKAERKQKGSKGKKTSVASDGETETAAKTTCKVDVDESNVASGRDEPEKQQGKKAALVEVQESGAAKLNGSLGAGFAGGKGGSVSKKRKMVWKTEVDERGREVTRQVWEDDEESLAQVEQSTRLEEQARSKAKTVKNGSTEHSAQPCPKKMPNLPKKGTISSFFKRT